MASYQDLKKHVANMSMRERIMVSLVGAVLFLFPGFFTFVDGNQSQIAQLEKQLEAQQVEEQRILGEIALWQAKLNGNPNDVMRQEIAKYSKELSEIDAALTKETVNLVDASLMTKILLDVLKVDNSLEILSVESKEPQIALKKDDINLYQHGIVIQIKGRYQDILRHMKNVEQLPYSFYWKSMDYKVDEYPYAIAVIELYTLSINKDFIRG